MPFYIILGKFTDEGIKAIKESPKRVEEQRVVIEKAGGKLHGFYYTMGEYDFVSIVEGPSDEVALTLLLSLGRLGRVRTVTLKAFPVEEAAKIIEKLP
ncbi:MAG TPA: GYD domain-containing protein [Nitrososphaeria archaeon]|nr:GYD domain-containing protein [Nitrososphaeria archaeon]